MMHKSGLMLITTVKNWIYEDGRQLPNWGVEALAKTERDFLYLMEFTHTPYVDHMYRIGEYKAPAWMVVEFYPELN